MQLQGKNNRISKVFKAQQVWLTFKPTDVTVIGPVELLLH